MAAKKATTVANGLARARIVAAELNANTDALNEGLARVEAALASLGVDASIDITDNTVSAMGYGASLSFDKHGTKWGLYYATGLLSVVETWTPQRLLTCAKVIRLVAIDHLPELIETVVRRAEEQNRMIASKLEKLDGILGTLDIFEMPSAERPGPSYFEDFQPDDES